MNNNARHKFLYSLAAEIAARENISPFSDNNEANIVSEIMERGECSKQTARAVWGKWLLTNRRPKQHVAAPESALISFGQA